MSASRGFRGSFSMISRSGGLKPRAVAGKPSVTRFTQSSCTGIRASGRPRIAVRKMLEPESRALAPSRPAPTKRRVQLMLITQDGSHLLLC